MKRMKKDGHKKTNRVDLVNVELEKEKNHMGRRSESNTTVPIQ